MILSFFNSSHFLKVLLICFPSIFSLLHNAFVCRSPLSFPHHLIVKGVFMETHHAICNVFRPTYSTFRFLSQHCHLCRNLKRFTLHVIYHTHHLIWSYSLQIVYEIINKTSCNVTLRIHWIDNYEQQQQEISRIEWNVFVDRRGTCRNGSLFHYKCLTRKRLNNN